MGREIVYCDLCGERILEDEFEKKLALNVGNRNYCPRCSSKAPSPPPAPSSPGKTPGLLRTLPGGSPPRSARPGPSGKTSALLPALGGGAPGKKATTRRHGSATDRKGRTGYVPPADRSPPPRRLPIPPVLLIAAGVFAAVLLLVLVIVVVSRGRPGRRAGAPAPPAVVALRRGERHSAGGTPRQGHTSASVPPATARPPS